MILNLTQHPATAEQLAAGVVDLPEGQRQALCKALTFDEIPSKDFIASTAEYIVSIAMMNGLGGDGDDDPIPESAMIGGAPYLMGALEAELRLHCIQPLYAFSMRESEEVVQSDGSVQKINVFRHKGFVRA